MNRELLEKKLAENKRRLKEMRINSMKSEIMQSIENFSEKYRFADDTEKKYIEIFMEKLPVFYDLKTLQKNPVNEHGKCYLCFLEGSEEIFDIYLYGNFSDFLCDYDDFFFLSAHLLVIDEDFQRYVFIDDEFNQKEFYIN